MDRADVCDAVCIMRDGRWGGIKNRCQEPFGHRGDHEHALDACEPVAALVWPKVPCVAMRLGGNKRPPFICDLHEGHDGQHYVKHPIDGWEERW